MSQVKPIRQIIQQFLHSIGIEEKVEEYQAIALWDEVVGKEISERTEPYKIAQGTLFVKVKDPAWRNELHFFKAEIKEKLNKRISKKVINDIKFY